MTNSVKVSDLRVGDKVDLEGDAYADPKNDSPALEFEFQRVEAIDFETPDCTVVYFQDTPAVGFPPGHELKVETRGAAVKSSADEFQFVTDFSGVLVSRGVPAHADAFVRLVPNLSEGSSAIAMRVADRAYGIVLKVAGTDEAAEAAKSTVSFTKAKALGELSEMAMEVADSYPNLETWVDLGDGESTVRAFVTEGSDLQDKVSEIVASTGPSTFHAR